MPAADHVALLRRRGKAHTYLSVTPGTVSASTNAATGGSTARIEGVYGVYQDSNETAVSGIAVRQGDEILLLEAGPLQSASIRPKAGDQVEDAGDLTYTRRVVAFKPVRDAQSAIWAYRLLLRGNIDAE